jgi:tyrosinase
MYIPGYAGPFNNFTDLRGWVPGTGGGCITTGPFASYNLSLGPGTIPTNHCLTRNFNDAFAWALSSAQIANTTKQPTFEHFRIELEGQPITPTMKLHDGGNLSLETRYISF